MTSIVATGQYKNETPNPQSLIKYMKDVKGISFNIIDERDAALFLENRNYYFKLKAFAKNFEKYHDPFRKEMYINLDFGHLVELSRLDKELRGLVLMLTLDIEHYLKVRINASAMHCKTDPYQLSQSFLSRVNDEVTLQQESDLEIETARDVLVEIAQTAHMAASSTDPHEMTIAANAMIRKLSLLTSHRNPTYILDSLDRMKESPYSDQLVRKYTNHPMPYWVLLELITFGNIVSFYRKCFSGKDTLLNDDTEKSFCKTINPFLRCVVTLRNAAAHSDCLLNGLSNHSAKLKQKSKILGVLRTDYLMQSDTIANVGSVRLALDLAAVLICYDLIVPKGQTSNAASLRMEQVAERFREHSNWFAKNSCIKDFFSYIDVLLTVFGNQFMDAIEMSSHHI